MCLGRRGVMVSYNVYGGSLVNPSPHPYVLCIACALIAVVYRTNRAARIVDGPATARLTLQGLAFARAAWKRRPGLGEGGTTGARTLTRQP